MNKKKRAQMEIMGLTIVIILMILGMLFVVRFVILKPKNNLKQSYADTVLAANLKNSLLLFSTQCNNRRIQDLLADCVSGNIITCPSFGAVPSTSCTYAESRIREIFDKTLDRWNREYLFEACIWRGGSCDASSLPFILAPPGLTESDVCNQEIESKFSPVQTEKGIMKVTLQICTNVDS